MRLRAPAKINVCLHLGETRESDGRHELVTIFQPLELADELHVTRSPSGADKVVCPGVEGPNLVSAAIAAFREDVSWDGEPLHVEIDKRIPVAGGMAGGSADAGAILRALQELAGGEADPRVVELIARELGADVPGQLEPRRYLATGAGETLEPLPPTAPYAVLVVPHHTGLSTARVFQEADRLDLPHAGDQLRAAAERIRAQPDLDAAQVVNDLQPAALSLVPELQRTLDDLTDRGADVALLSGSGPTVLGLFADDDAAKDAAAALPHATLTRTARP